MMNVFSLFIWNVRIDEICIKRIPGYSTFPSTFGLWCHCGQILTSILSGWLTYCMTDNCSSLQRRQTSTVYEFSKEEASLTVRKVKPFVTAALATSGVCTVKQPAAAAVMSTFQKDCDFLKFSLIKLFMQWVELSETLPFYSEPRVARLFTFFFRYKLRFCTALRQIFAIFSRGFQSDDCLFQSGLNSVNLNGQVYYQAVL